MQPKINIARVLDGFGVDYVSLAGAMEKTRYLGTLELASASMQHGWPCVASRMASTAQEDC